MTAGEPVQLHTTINKPSVTSCHGVQMEMGRSYTQIPSLRQRCTTPLVCRFTDEQKQFRQLLCNTSVVAAGSLAKGRNLSELLPPPHSSMHIKWDPECDEGQVRHGCCKVMIKQWDMHIDNLCFIVLSCNSVI